MSIEYVLNILNATTPMLNFDSMYKKRTEVSPEIKINPIYMVPLYARTILD